jgi:hypothetical protein
MHATRQLGVEPPSPRAAKHLCPGPRQRCPRVHPPGGKHVMLGCGLSLGDDLKLLDQRQVLSAEASGPLGARASLYLEAVRRETSERR